MVRKYKKRTYKKYKKTYKKNFKKYRKYYKKSNIKKPEIRIIDQDSNMNYANANGRLEHITNITQVNTSGEAQPDKVVFKVNGKEIEGRKIRLKYLYIKGYLNVSGSGADLDDFNGKFYVFRVKKNLTNSLLTWTDMVDMPMNLGDPTTWTNDQRLNILYKYSWKNDIKGLIKKKVKNMYRRYDDANNIVPFKLRIPLYDCVMTCDTYYDTTTNTYKSQACPSTNDIYISFLTNRGLDANTALLIKWKLYYTDY